jgi:hypothetical protein
MNAKLRKFVAAEQCFGALMWFLQAYPHLLNPSGGWPGLILALFANLNILAILASILLWRGHKEGVGLSVPLQVLQVPLIQLPRFIYAYFSGISLLTELSASSQRVEVGFKMHIGAVCEFWIGDLRQTGIRLGVDLSAIFTLALLLRAFRAARTPASTASPAKPDGHPEGYRTHFGDY